MYLFIYFFFYEFIWDLHALLQFFIGYNSRHLISAIDKIDLIFILIILVMMLLIFDNVEKRAKNNFTADNCL